MDLLSSPPRHNLDAPASSPHPKATLPLAGTPGLGPTVLLVASVLTLWEERQTRPQLKDWGGGTGPKGSRGEVARP